MNSEAVAAAAAAAVYDGFRSIRKVHQSDLYSGGMFHLYLMWVLFVSVSEAMMRPHAAALRPVSAE